METEETHSLTHSFTHFVSPWFRWEAHTHTFCLIAFGREQWRWSACGKEEDCSGPLPMSAGSVILLLATKVATANRIGSLSSIEQWLRFHFTSGPHWLPSFLLFSPLFLFLFASSLSPTVQSVGEYFFTHTHTLPLSQCLSPSANTIKFGLFFFFLFLFSSICLCACFHPPKIHLKTVLFVGKERKEKPTLIKGDTKCDGWCQF